MKFIKQYWHRRSLQDTARLLQKTEYPHETVGYIYDMLMTKAETQNNG